MKTIKNPTEHKLRLMSKNGVTVTHIDPGEVKAVPEVLFETACVQGCVPTGEDADTVNPALEELSGQAMEAQFFKAFDMVLARRDPTLVNANGCPKKSALKPYVGEHANEDRDMFWAKYSAGKGT